MKKRHTLTAVLTGAALLASNAVLSVPVSADAVKVVTLGADLSEDQKQTMMNYFKVSSNEAQIIYITNADERARLSSYIPLEQIGSRTVSCAYVKPTSSGGIKVRTANLNYVTCNMIASTLSTSGVTNCEVIAACPFEVSGTGALCGITMAYETASGQQLEESKKEIATEELVVTGDLGEKIGQDDAVHIINESKMDVIQNNVDDRDQINNIVTNIVVENGYAVSQDDIDTIIDLLEKIAAEDYEYEDVKETLETVESNVDENFEPVQEEIVTEGGEEIETDGESILTGVDESVLGEDVIAGSTVEGLVEEGVSESGEEQSWDEEEWTEVEGEGDVAAPVYGEGDVEAADNGVDELYEQEAAINEEMNAVDSLEETDRTNYYKADQFCRGAYEGDDAALSDAMGEDFYLSFSDLDAETGAKLTKAVKAAYLKVLQNDLSEYVQGEEDVYMNAELNLIVRELKTIFSQDGKYPDEDILADYSEDAKSAMYKDTKAFFEKLYGETAPAPAEEVYQEETSSEESYSEESYSEETYEEESYGEESEDWDYEEESYE